MRRDRRSQPPAPPVGAISDAALPLEYRYSTALASCFFAGLALLALMVLFGSGAGALVAAPLGLGALAIGSMGLLADPSGFLRSMGKRLVITDDLLQEVDEQLGVVWSLGPEEIVGVHTACRRRVFPWGIADDWRAEVWFIALKDGGTVRIPVWLLPHRGERFKNRFQAFRRPPSQPRGCPAHSS